MARMRAFWKSHAVPSEGEGDRVRVASTVRALVWGIEPCRHEMLVLGWSPDRRTLLHARGLEHREEYASGRGRGEAAGEERLLPRDVVLAQSKHEVERDQNPREGGRRASDEVVLAV